MSGMRFENGPCLLLLLLVVDKRIIYFQEFLFNYFSCDLYQKRDEEKLTNIFTVDDGF